MPQDETSDVEEDLEASVASATERRPPEPALFPDDIIPEVESEGKKGVRGRARSLSHTLGELFGVRRGKRSAIGDGEAETSGLLGGREGAGSE